MNKIELKRIYRVNASGYINYDGFSYYGFRDSNSLHSDCSKFIIEFKLLSELHKCDKKELNIFITQDFLNKGIISRRHLGGWEYLEFDINLEEINNNINKITNVTKILSNNLFNHCSDCSCSRCNKNMFFNYESNHIKNDNSKSLINQKEAEINRLQKEIAILKNIIF